MIAFWGPLLRERIRVAARSENLASLRAFANRVCAAAGLSETEGGQIELVVDEACSNVIRHAYDAHGLAGDIDLEAVVRRGSIQLILNDRGKSFDFGTVEVPDLDRYVEAGRRGGWGVFIIKSTMDEARYRSGPEGNRLEIVKYVHAAPLLPWLARLSLHMRFAVAAVVFVTTLFASGGFALVSMQSARVQRDAFLEASAATEALAHEAVDPMVRRNVPAAGALVAAAVRAHPQLSDVALVDTEGVVWGHTDTARLLTRYVPSPAAPAPAAGSAAIEVRDGDGAGLQVAAGVRLEGMLLGTVYARLARARVAERQRPVIRRTLLLSLFAWMTACAVVLTLGVRYVAPAQRLSRAVVKISAEGFKRRIALRRRDEYGQIAQVFDEMIVRFREQQRSLVERERLKQELQTMQELQKALEPIRRFTKDFVTGSVPHAGEIAIRGEGEYAQITEVFTELVNSFRESESRRVEQERLMKELQVAQEIQFALLPRGVPELPGFELATLYRAARDVGGDYYDLLAIHRNLLGVVVADVSGKGVPGSLGMTMMKMALRLESKGDRSPSDVLSRVNAALLGHLKEGMFVTAEYLLLDSERRTIRYSSAGHNFLVLYRGATGQVFRLHSTGLPLGLDLPEPALFERRLKDDAVSLAKDDLLLLYTDGVTEAMDPAFETYGEERLLAFLRERHALPAQAFVDALQEELDRFTGDRPQSDDITVVVIKDRESVEEALHKRRRQLFDLIEREGVTVAEACRRSGISRDSYYRLRAMREREGESALWSVEKVVVPEEREGGKLSLDDRDLLLRVVSWFPELSPRGMAATLAQPAYGGLFISPRSVRSELEWLDLAAVAQRRRHAERNPPPGPPPSPPPPSAAPEKSPQPTP